MSSYAGLGAILGIALTASACTGGCPWRRQTATPAPAQAPRSWVLALEVQRDRIRLLRAVPSQGTPTTSSIDSQLPSLRRQDSLWIEYALRAGTDRAVANGAFAVSMTAIVEGAPDMPGGLVRVPSRIVTVRVPYAPDATTIAFSRVDVSDVPSDKWLRVPVGQSGLNVTAQK